MDKIKFKDASRMDWSREVEDVGQLTLLELQFGTLLRIVDALEGINAFLGSVNVRPAATEKKKCKKNA
jgi:hypothetical protein